MSNELTIQRLILILRRRRNFILWSVVVCFSIAVIFCIFKKPRYEGVAEIEIQKSPTDGLGLQNLAGSTQEQSDALDSAVTVQTDANILESTNIALKVIKDLNLDQTEDYKPSFHPIGWVFGFFTPSGPQDPANASLEDSPHRRDHAVKTFQKRLKVKPVPGTRLIELRYRSSDQKLAAAVVNDVSKSLVDFTVNSRYAATSQASSWLTAQLGNIKKEAEKAQAKVEQLQKESGVYSLGTSDAQGNEMAYNSTVQRLQDATQALSAATSNRILKGGLYKTVQNGNPELISGLVGSTLAGASSGVSNSLSLLQNLRTQQATLSSQYAQDLSRYGSANPKLGDEKAGLDALDKDIKTEVARVGQRAANDYKAAQETENSLRAVYNQERRTAAGLDDKAIGLVIAQQEATDARSLYQTLLSHLKEAGVLGGLRSSNISVVDIAHVPSKPLPDVPIYLGLSVLCGAFIGLAGALVTDASDERLGAITTIEHSLQARVLAVLPMTGPGISQNGLTAKIRKQLGSETESASIPRVAAIAGRNTAYVEALRGLRTSLLLPANGRSPKTILVTSAAEKEGKSTLSLNLAAVLVLNGSKVLLVDADMRSAGLSGYMGFERQDFGLIDHEAKGLSDALSGSREPAIITPFPELPTLSAISAGTSTNNPAELLGSDRMASMVTSWRDEYDFVVIDSPPVLAVTDALLLARLADTTLLVARHEETKQNSLNRAYRMLSEGDRTTVDLVVNGVRRDSVSFNEFYGYNGTSYYSEV
jgi:succinoglycan biosynthesis transport protein ExoP